MRKFIFNLVKWSKTNTIFYRKTFYRISEEVPERQRQFSMAIITVSDSPGVALSGLIAIPVHNAICNLSIPSRLL